MQSGVQRNLAGSILESLETAVIPPLPPSNRSGESVRLISQGSVRACVRANNNGIEAKVVHNLVLLAEHFCLLDLRDLNCMSG